MHNLLWPGKTMENEDVLNVWDSGLGIPEEYKEKLFTKFESTRSTGSGLPISR